jgi:hypothetical protein
VKRLLLTLALVGCPSPSATPAAVYGALVDGGCLKPSPDGEQAVAAEHARHDQAWLECMFQTGGTITSCRVPCSDAGP